MKLMAVGCNDELCPLQWSKKHLIHTYDKEVPTNEAGTLAQWHLVMALDQAVTNKFLPLASCCLFLF